MYDYHLHSDYSMGCKYSMEDMAIMAIENNLKSICFTDHIELEATENKIDILFHPQDYFKKVKKIKYKYINEIEVLSGVEIGLQPHLGKRYSKLIKENPFDFVLASVHSINSKDIFRNEYLDNKALLDRIIEYYEEIYLSINTFNDYDILAHIDLIDRYFYAHENLPRIEDYKWIIEKIFLKVIEEGKGIELNTSGLRYGLKYFHPKIELLNLYKKLGGEIITIGSDAYNPIHVGYMYKEAEKLLKELGFKYIFIYRDRRKYPIDII
ncbi:MAG TPA: histidinol-phosphatase HisJ family protein [Tissierellales bacterium]|nr:histidinol-phosphatase HisJ family protein [Tissierellales bacterium]